MTAWTFQPVPATRSPSMRRCGAAANAFAQWLFCLRQCGTFQCLYLIYSPDRANISDTIRKSLTTHFSSFVCCFSPCGAKNDTHKTESTMLPQAKVYRDKDSKWPK